MRPWTQVPPHNLSSRSFPETPRPAVDTQHYLYLSEAGNPVSTTGIKQNEFEIPCTTYITDQLTSRGLCRRKLLQTAGICPQIVSCGLPNIHLTNRT